MNKALSFATLALPLALSALSPVGAEARQAASSTTQTTRLVVHVVSHDAKVIGQGVGGARVSVKDLETGKELASGMQMGGTGSTPLIINTPRARGAQIYEGAGSFTATLELSKPTRVEVIAEGPMGATHATQRASKTLLLVPGRHIEGDGLVLELHGFTVEMLPAAEGAANPPAAKAGQALPLRARVTMLCGCPTEPGGTWDANDYDITARLLQNGKVVVQAPLAYAGQTSTYAGSIMPPSAGTYQLELLAFDKTNSNAGLYSMQLTVSP
jgi:hypothetical protein